MIIQASIRAPGRNFIRKYQQCNFQIAKVPPVRLVVDFELTKRGKVKSATILDHPDFNADVIDNTQPLNKKQFRRRLISTIPRQGQTRVYAYLLSTKEYTIESQLQMRYKWSKSHCRKNTPEDSPRPWAKHLYQYRVRHVVRYKFKVARELEKYSASSRRWEYDKAVEDPRGWQSERSEGAWTPYALLKPQLAAAPCVDPGEGENYRAFQIVSSMPSVTLYTV